LPAVVALVASNFSRAAVIAVFLSLLIPTEQPASVAET
jgi:hypothetical protein